MARYNKARRFPRRYLPPDHTATHRRPPSPAVPSKTLYFPGRYGRWRVILGPRVVASRLLAIASSVSLPSPSRVASVLTAGFEQVKAAIGHPPHQALADQELEAVDAGLAHRFGFLDLEAAREHAKAAKYFVVGRSEQVITPVDCRPHGHVPFGCVAPTACEELETAL